MFLHVLSAADDDGGAEGQGEGDEWGGRLKQLTKAIPNEVEQRLILSKRRLKSEIEAAKAEMGAVKAEMGAVKADVAAVKADVAAVKADVAAVKVEMVTKAEFNEITDLLRQLSATMSGQRPRTKESGAQLRTGQGATTEV